MNRQHTHTLTHFGPLFITSLGGWMAFNLVNSGAVYIVPGMIVAGLLAYAGTLVALRTQTSRDLRTTERFSTAAAPRIPARHSPRPAFDAMDIAAGD